MLNPIIHEPVVFEIIKDRTIPHLMGDIHYKNTQIYDLEHRLDEFTFLRDLHEEDNLRLRRFINDIQYHFETALKSRDWEIERQVGRIQFLEEELFNLTRRNQPQLIGQMKDSYDPQRIRDLERMLTLKDNEIDTLKRKLKELQERSEMLQNEASHREKNRTQFENDVRNLPFVLENDEQKKQNAELKRKMQVMNEEWNQCKSLYNDSNADVEKLKRKIKEYQMLEKQRAENEEDFKRQLQPVYIKVSEDQNLLDGLLGLIHYVRESICDVIFEIFVRSANQAHQRKMSSTIIFTINVKELKERNIRGFIIVLYLYKKMKQFIKLYFPYYGKIGLTDEIQKITLGAQKANQPCDFRDNTNQWLEENVNLIQQQHSKKDKLEQNKEYYHLYRLLALKYRTKYPMKGDKPMKVDLDVRVRLENKICVALLRIFLDE